MSDSSQTTGIRVFRDELARFGIRDWEPPGHFSEYGNVWVSDADIQASFPDAAVDIFEAVDVDSFWFQHRNEVITDILRREFPGHHPFLEVGSGSGVVVDYINRHTSRPVASVEPILSGAVAASRRGVALSFCGDLASLDLPASSVPTVGVFDVIEHLEHPRDLLEECRRILTPEGLLIVTAPAYRWLWSDFDEWNGHFTRYTRSSLESLLKDVGFVTSTSTYVFAPLLPAAAIVRIVMERLRPKRSSSEIESNVEGSLSIDNPAIDGAVRAILRAERSILGLASIPFGTSVLATARVEHS